MIETMLADIEAALRAPRKPPWDLGDRIPSAVAVPLVEKGDGLEIWVIKRPDGMRHHPRELAFPGGKAEPNETLLDTALRELQEELGIERSAARSLGALTPMPVATSRYAIHPFVIAVAADAVVTPATDEVAELIRAPMRAFFDGTIEYSIVDMGSYRSPIFGFASGQGQNQMFGASAHILLEMLETYAPLARTKLPAPKPVERAPWL